ncbi:hypothetical protein ACFSC4_28715 [Deinococcus malanensis]|nr:hypothetical protein [Deinococcus malanensis]
MRESPAVARPGAEGPALGLDAYTEVVQRTLAFWADRTSTEDV